MPIDTFSIKLEGLSFPDFGNDHSKQNFRLMIDVDYFNENGKPTTTHITFPADKFWQWRDKTKRFYIPPKPAVGKTVGLDLDVFKSNSSEFSETDLEILVAQGKLHSIAVHIIDVKDESVADIFIKGLKIALPIVIDQLAGGLPTLIGNSFAKKLVGTIVGEFKGDGITTALLAKAGGKDKVLFNGGKFESSFGKIVVKGKGVFKNKNDMTGDYEIQLSFSKIDL